MPVSLINIGTAPNQGNGDSLRTAFQKINDNFSLLLTSGSGYTGSIGIQGDIGYTGSAGIDGFNGFDGYAGSAGDIGYTGSAGIDGFNGFDGINGIDGYTGSTGDIGYTGSAGGITASRIESWGSTSIINPNMPTPINIDGFKGYVLYKISTDAASRVVVYSSQLARDNDISRPTGVSAAVNSGVIAEIITEGSGEVVLCPAVYGFNNDIVVSNIIPIHVYNLSPDPAVISVSLTLLGLEL